MMIKLPTHLVLVTVNIHSPAQTNLTLDPAKTNIDTTGTKNVHIRGKLVLGSVTFGFLGDNMTIPLHQIRPFEVNMKLMKNSWVLEYQ